MGKSVRQTDDGLPILSGNGQTSDTTADGLPILKKKDANGLVSPSGSSPNTDRTGQPVGTSDSGQRQLTANYKNNSLTPNDVKDDKPLGAFLGPSPEQISHSINNKSKNLSRWQGDPSDAYIGSIVRQHQDVQGKISKMDTPASRRMAGQHGSIDAYESDLNNLKKSEQYLRSEIQKNYDSRKQKLVPELIESVKNSLRVNNFSDEYDNPEKEEFGIKIQNTLQWDPSTHRLTPKSVQAVAKIVDDNMNKKGDVSANAQVSGDLDQKKRTYEDLTKSVVDYLNTIPVQKAQDKFKKEYSEKNPKLKDAMSASQEVNEFFSKDRVDSIKAKVNVDRDKELIRTGQKYYGEGGVFQQNKDFIGIQEKFAQLVADGKMTEDVAKKQIQSELKQNPALKKINESMEAEIRKINEKTQTEFQNFIISRLKKNKPNLTIYEDGSVGVAGMSKDQYTNMMEGYEEGLTDVAKKMGAESESATARIANLKAKNAGAFWGSMGSSLNELTSAFSKVIFNKTQWGSKDVQYYEGQEIASPQVSQSQIAASWNWKGLESLKDPNFWMSKTGAMVPVIAGGSAVGLATEGACMPEYVGWLANAGLFTAQSGLSTYNQMLNTKDAQGNTLTEADASNKMAKQMEDDFLPNMLMMAATSGTLMRAKNIIKPTIGATVRKGILGAAEAQPFFTWSGYNDWSTSQEAEGKKTDFWDYMQSKDFKDNLINGMVVGGGLSLLHAPGSYMKSVDNWTKMIHTSEGEFKNLIPQNYALGQEMSGSGNYFRDALKLHIFNTDPSTLDEAGKRQLADFKNTLLYSTNLDRNIRQANLDPNNIRDLYQAHNLSLADQHDYLSEQASKEGNKSLSDIYKDKAKDYREQAKAASNDEAKYHYLVNDEGHPIFMSDKSFKTLEQEGTIAKWIKDITIKDIHSSDDPEFSQRYKDYVMAKEQASVEGVDITDHAKNLLIENKVKLGIHYEEAKKNPQQFYKNVADQAFGRNADGSMSDYPNAERQVRGNYGDDIVDLAKVMFPMEEKSSSEVKTEAKPTEPKEEYKPNIRDDYFAQKDFFTPEEKEQFAKLDDAGKDKMIDEKRAELKAQSEEDKITVSEMIDKPGIYKGKRGAFSQDGQAVVFKVEGSNREYELGNVNEIGGRSLKDFGIEQENSVVGANEDNNITVRGREYVNKYSDPLAAINYDEEGNVVSVNLETSDGKKRAFRGNIAEDVAYQIHLKEISKNNEQPALEEFINSDEPTRKEIEDAGLGETSEEKPTQGTEKVPRITIKPKEVAIPSPKIETDGKSNKTQEAKGQDVLKEKEGAESVSADAGAAPPLPPIPEARVPEESPKDEFSSVRKEKNKEIEGAKELFANQKVIKWNDTYRNALSNAHAMYPDKPLYEALRRRVGDFTAMLDSKKLFNPTSEDNAVFNTFKLETTRRMAAIQGWDSNDPIQVMAAQAEFSALQKDLYDVARVTNPGGEAGRAFNILQSEIANDLETGLKIRRMELQSVKGSKLTETELESSAKDFQKEHELAVKEYELKLKQQHDKFDKEISSLKEQLKNAGKNPTTKEKREKLLSQTGKEFADKIRAGKLKGTYATFPGLPQTINAVLEGIAKLVEGGFTLAEAIGRFAKDNNLKDEDKFKNDLFEILGRQEKQGEAYEKIEAMAKGGATDVSNDMVSKNLIRDYINSHIGLHENKDILNIAHAELKKILPDLEKDRLREAYLKDGEFKQPTKKQVENSFKESQKNFTKLTSLEKDIADLRDKKDLFKKTSNKSTPYDKDIAAKEKEKDDIMRSMGIKTSSEDKYSKASYDQRAQSHNERLENLTNYIQNKLDQGVVSPTTEKALIKLKGQLDASKIKLDPSSALSQEKTLEGGLATLKSIKSEFDRTTIGDISKVSDIRRDLQKVLDKFSGDKEESEHGIKLQRAKDKAKRDMDEYARKLIHGEFEDKPVVQLTKYDAELIKLQRDRDVLRSLFNDQKRKLEKGNKKVRARVADFARAVMVDGMIGSPLTLLKVGTSAVVRPTLEVATKLTFGKVFEGLPFDTTKAITEQAKAGGETLSLAGIRKANEAYFKQYTPEKIDQLYQTANDKFEKLNTEYEQGKGTMPEKELAVLKSKRDDALVSVVSNSMYQFIGGGSLKEAMSVLLHRSTQMERQFGDFDQESWQKAVKDETTRDKMLRRMDNAQYLANFVGRAHAAEKNFSARFSFANGFVSRLEYAVKNGVDISNPDKILEIGHESYLDWERGKYQESNWVTDTWNKVTSNVEKASPELSYLMRSDVAITRVPVNMLREGIMEYTLGGFRGSIMAAREYYKAKGIVLQDGYSPEHEEKFKQAMKEQLNKIDPDKAATIIRSFRKGGFGMGLYALALFGHAAFGGWPHKGQTAEDKKKKDREAETGTPELETGRVQIGSWIMPEWASKVVEHTPAFAPLGFGLGLSKVYENNIIDGKSTVASATNSATAQINHIVNSIPQAELVTFLGGKILDRIKPASQWDDIDQYGNPMKRHVFNFSDHFKYIAPFGLNIYGDKKDELSEHYYKQAVQTQKSFRGQITDVEINTSLSKKEKEDQRQELMKQMNEAIDDIYTQNKENPQ